MTPLAAPELEPLGTAHLQAAGDPAPARWFACGLFAIATAIGVALVVAGLPLPEPLPVLALAVFLVLAINRCTVFPTELAVSAEAAVLTAAIVAFRHDSAFVGPWCVAFLAGPLDLLHWRQRSFVRMAFNAGNRMMATLAGAVSFTVLLHSDLFGTGAFRFGAAVLGAALAYAAVDTAIGVVLVRLHTGGSWMGAARVVGPVDALNVPLAVVGGAAGYLATQVGWWVAALVLVPTLFIPELALARPFRRAPTITRIATTIVPAVLGVVVLAVVTPLPAASTLVALVVIASVAGFELRVDLPVPPLVAALAAAAVIVSGDAVLAGAVVVAVTATTVSWIVAREASWWAPVCAGGAALVAAGVYDLRPSPAAALVAALLFELLVAAGLARVVWTAPFLCVAVALGEGWHAIGMLGAAAFGVGFAAVLVVAAACGAPPWGSRIVGPFVTRHRSHVLHAIVAAVSLFSLGCAVTAGALDSVPEALVALASASAAALGAMAMGAVRQWRFSLRARVWQATLVLAATVGVVLAYPPLARDGGPQPIAILATSLAVMVAIASPLVRLGDAGAAKARDEDDAEAVAT